MSKLALVMLFVVCGVSAIHAQPRDDAALAFRADAPIQCPLCDDWNVPQAPFRVFGNTYYVGTTELSALLIVSDDGLILIDAALPQSAPLIGRP